MEETPSNILPRKRKQISPSTSLKHFMGPVTRNQYHSGRVCSDTTSQRNIQQPQFIPDSSLKKPKSVHCPKLENGASLYLSIKDLRARARRVFPPTGTVEGKNELRFDFGEEISNGPVKITENSGNFLSGLKNSDLGLGSESGFCVSDREVQEKSLNIEGFNPGSKDLVAGIGNQGTSNVIDEDMNKINQVDRGNECCENKRNWSVSSTRTVPKYCSRGKVYKSPSLFSYRRLLPFLTGMVKEESCTTRVKIVDEDGKVENPIHLDSSSSWIPTDSKFAEHEHIGEYTNGTRPSDKGQMQEVEIQHEVSEQGLHAPGKELPQNKEHVSLSNAEGRSHENGLTEVHELVEEFIQTTPPGSTILTELDVYDTDANAEVNNLNAQNPVHPSNRSTCSTHVSVLKRSHTSPTRRNSTISGTKLVLNPCSRSKLYKTSSSFSYRRLLPFLMDVAKSASNNDPSPKIQNDMESSQHSELLASSDNDLTLNKNEACDFQEKQEEKCQELPVDIKATSLDGSSDSICWKLSTPFFSSSSEISLGTSHSASSENFTEPDMQNGLQMERTFLHSHARLDKPGNFEGKIQNAGIRICDDEGNRSVETSCSSVNHESIPGESRLEVLPHQPVDIVKNSSPKGLVYHKDKLDKTKNVTLDQSSSRIGEFYSQGESPTKGILKRNPRGCRGLCCCLNCSSFRLHAERAFEFSRNQLLDAEEVALTLINELAELRDILEKYTVDGSDLAAIQLNQLQVRESCKKALAMEQQAKRRLSQMNDDLKVHCRIAPLQRPRVTFSRFTEVKTILDTKISGSP